MGTRHVYAGAIAVAALLTAGSATAQSQEIYAGGAIGTATFFDQGNIEYDYLGFVIAGQVGYRWTPDIRLEAEIAYESTEAEVSGINFDVDVLRLGASAYYDFHGVSIGGMTPFAGGGLGLADLDGRAGVVGTEPSAHIDGGASLTLGTNIDVVPMARWELTDDASNFQLRVGARFWL